MSCAAHGPRLRSICLALLVLFVSPASLQPAPIQVHRSPNTYGPDGPWQAYRVYVGNPLQQIDLFPGTSKSSYVLGEGFCANNPNCSAATGGFYNVNQSSTAITNGFVTYPPLYINAPLQSLGEAQWAIDDLWLGVPDTPALAPNVSIGIVLTGKNVYPTKEQVPYTLGGLDLGCSLKLKEYSGGSNYANILTSYLYDNGVIPSASFGLHIGSVEPDIPASLWFGGYDQTRVMAPPLSQVALRPGDGEPLRLTLTLADVGIGTIRGASPFGNATLTGLLNMTSQPGQLGSYLEVSVEPLTPYMFLPLSVCEALAAPLPVTLDQRYGLYLWDTNDPRYTEIVSSMNYVSFSFLNVRNELLSEIKVPFKLLNLTLEPPLADTELQYCPCYPDDSGTYVLGRSFLAAAFLGANWEPNGSNPTFFIAQAGGPNIMAGPNVSATPIGANSSTISHRVDGVTWEDTWEGYWTPLPSTITRHASRGFSSGAIAGVAIGVILGVLMLFALLWNIFAFRTRHRHSEWRWGGFLPPMQKLVMLQKPSRKTQDKLFGDQGSPRTTAELHGHVPVRQLEAAYQRGFEDGVARSNRVNAHELPAFVELPAARSEVVLERTTDSPAGEATEQSDDFEKEQASRDAEEERSRRQALERLQRQIPGAGLANNGKAFVIYR